MGKNPPWPATRSSGSSEKSIFDSSVRVLQLVSTVDLLSSQNLTPTPCWRVDETLSAPTNIIQLYRSSTTDSQKALMSGGNRTPSSPPLPTGIIGVPYVVSDPNLVFSNFRCLGSTPS